MHQARSLRLAPPSDLFKRQCQNASDRSDDVLGSCLKLRVDLDTGPEISGLTGRNGMDYNTAQVHAKCLPGVHLYDIFLLS